MQTFRKHPLETIAVPFDFSEFIATNGDPFTTYTVSVGTGVSLYDTVGTDDVVTLQIGGGIDQTYYTASVTATNEAGSLTLTKQIFVDASNGSAGPVITSNYADSYADSYA